jgi:hypothetical protein
MAAAMMARGGRAVTEAEWLAGEAPEPMLAFLRGRAGDRKLRLYCCGCCRRVWGHLGRGRRAAVGIAERYADGRAGWWGSFQGEALALPQSGWQRDDGRAAQTAADVAVQLWGRDRGPDGVSAAATVSRLTRAGGPQADLVRDISGHPFRPVEFSPSRASPAAVALAQGMYDSRDFAAMPVPADALQDAGCERQDVLGHCRGGGEHVRGCWVVDHVLGRG